MGNNLNFKVFCINQYKVFAMLIGLILSSYNPFHKDRVLRYASELKEIADIVDGHHYDVVWFNSDDISEMIKLDIDVIIKNTDKINPRFIGFTEENDNLFMILQKSQEILEMK